MLPIPSSARAETTSDEFHTPREYIEILEAYVDQDLILEKQQTTQLIQKINVVLGQIQELNSEKNLILREKKKIQNLIDDLKANYENLDKTLVIKNKSIDNEILQHKKLLETKKKELTETSQAKLEEVEKNMVEMVESSLKDEEQDARWSKELQVLEEKKQELEKRLDGLRHDNKRKLDDLLGETDAEVLAKSKQKEQQLHGPRKEVEDCKLELESIETQLDKKTRELEQLSQTVDQKRSILGSMENYKGSLDQQVLDLKLEKTQLLTQLDATNRDLSQFVETDYLSASQEYQDAMKRLETERLTRYKIENEIWNLQGKPCILVDKASKFTNAVEYSKGRVCVFAEVVLQGTNCAIIGINVDSECLDAVREHLDARARSSRYANWQIDISEQQGENSCCLEVNSTNRNTQKQIAGTLTFLETDAQRLDDVLASLAKGTRVMCVIGTDENTTLTTYNAVSLALETHQRSCS
ncbi:hypothetical protein OGAPHI_003227 [Ogataea philodendri]|uniref:Uncharacterized protein n=1 Tax=Ogataea philodendri TaxID=1378263 RepID=A0A9P8P733_9ASCO|nr:uncharacterized protein OGAPHI_003227 [Ogataea philodendri]KAH3666778.1 hypothetical protein OGAPHI_003227 [Ogataea philodendri]